MLRLIILNVFSIKFIGYVFATLKKKRIMLNVLIRSGCSFICNNEAHASGYMSIPGHSQCHSLKYFMPYAMQRILMMEPASLCTSGVNKCYPRKQN